MAVPSYITADDLLNAMSQAVFMALFDDSRPPTGNVVTVKAQANVTDILRRSLVRVTSYLPAIVKQYPPETGAAGISAASYPATDNIPALLKDAQLQIAKIYAFQRHPEYVKTYGAQDGGQMMKDWERFMERIQSGELQVTPNDTPPQPTPENVGGTVVDDGNRIITTSPDGTDNSGDY